MKSTDPIPPRKGKAVQVLIETPEGCRTKYKFDPESGFFRISHVLPAGQAFPMSFGFVPNTLADDGDPLDVLVLADEPLQMGALVDVRLIGILQAQQGEQGNLEENDRLIGVVLQSHDHADLHSLKDLAPRLLKELEEFFIAYNRARGRWFKIRRTGGPGAAKKALDAAEEQHLRKARRKRKGA